MKHLYNPYDKTTWIQEIDSLESDRFNSFLERNVKSNDSSVTYENFLKLCADVAGVMAKCFICIHLYKNSPKIPYWKERILFYATTLATLNVRPLKKNTHSTRQKCVDFGFFEKKEDLSNFFEIVRITVDNCSALGEMSPEEPVMTQKECYEQFAQDIFDVLKLIGQNISKQDIKEIEKCVKHHP